MPRTERQTTRSLLRTATLVVAATFLLVGVLGFIPGLTTDYESLDWWGHDSEAMLLGIFQVSVLHNVVHLLFGIAGLASLGSDRAARTYLLAGGSIYLLLWLWGLFLSDDHEGNVVPLNNADDWLHFALAIVMLALAFLLGGRDRREQLDEPPKA